MRSILHRTPSVSLVVALVALFVALGGGAYAATTTLIGHNQLAPNSVWHNNIGKRSVHMDNLTSSLKAQLDKAGKTGATGATGPRGATGPQGPAGSSSGVNPAGTGSPTGPQGPPGPSGVNDPMVYTFSGASGPDSGACQGNWANDTYDATFIVEPQLNGSYVVSKLVKGTFITIAGAQQPNPSPCLGPAETGGVTGAFYGTETFTVGADTDFNPYASCGAFCTPHTTSGSSSEAQNAAFVEAFFPKGSYSSVTDFDFVYTSGSQTWSDSNAGSVGNIDNG